MYRSEKIYHQLKNESLKYLICVPSYNRPNSAFMRWVQDKNFDVPRENLCVFIRNTPEQIALYEPYKNIVRLILLPKEVTDLGGTREAIVIWGRKHSPELLFMLDDRVNGIWWLNIVQRPKGEFLDVDSRSTPKTAFQIWAYQHLSHNMVATSISNKGFHWMPDRINKPIKPLNGSGMNVCVALSPKKLIEADANYKPIDKVGVEDIFILHQLLTKRLPFCNLSDITYNQVKPESSGGNSTVMPGKTRDERLLVVKKLFWEKTLGLPWGTKHPGYYVVNSKSESNLIRVNYNYWRKRYANTE